MIFLFAIKLSKYKQRRHIGLSDKEERSAKLTKPGNPLEKLRNMIDFEMFRPELEESILNHDKKVKPAANLM